MWHQIAVEHVAADADIIDLKAPVTEILFGIVEDLACLSAVLECWAGVTWDNWGIIKEVQETTAVTSEDDLLLSALNGGSELGSVCLLKLLAGLLRVSWSFT